jgi:hypothetical protein
MPKYKLKSGAHTVHTGGDPRVYGAGDILTLSDEQAKRFDEGRLEPVSKGEKDSAETDTEDTGIKSGTKTSTAPAPETEWTAVLSQGVNDVKGVITAIDNPEDLKALQKEEEKGSNRKMVLDAISKRQEELTKK